jgi:polyphosphate glucokinase
MAVLGIDFGGSGIKGALVDENTGEMISERFRLPTPEFAKPDDVADVIRQIALNFNYQGPIGVGLPAVILHGVVFTAANIDPSWIGVNAEKLFGKVTGCPCFVVNDADAAGVAEMSYGVGKDNTKGVVLFLTLGTGIGSAIFIDGRLLPNTELGHIEVRGKEAEKRASDAIRKKKEYTWSEWAVRLQEVLSRLEALFWPDLIVLGGGVSKEWENYLPLIHMRAKVLPASLLNQAGIVGAAIYAWQQFKDQSITT